jgi:acyl carrier protein phosphodiesterase
MNYLAHLALSGGIDEILAGNMIEDFITGRIEHPRNAFLTEELKVGVKLHRLIDTFTDTNENVANCKSLFYDSIGKYSPIVVDIFFDHFLIKNWSAFYDVPLPDFCQTVYNILPQYKEFYPPLLSKVVDSMISYEWLMHYEHEWGLERAMQSVNIKIGIENHLNESLPAFRANYDYLNQQFMIFYPELIAMSDNFIQTTIFANEK